MKLLWIPSMFAIAAIVAYIAHGPFNTKKEAPTIECEQPYYFGKADQVYVNSNGTTIWVGNVVIEYPPSVKCELTRKR